MQTALDAPYDALDHGERSFVAEIKEHGWFRTSVLGDDEGPGFAYTTGFWVNANQPELITFSIKQTVVHNVFWELFRDTTAGRPLPVGVRTDDVFANLPAYVFPVAKRHYPDFLGWSRWFYGGDDFPCLQIVWPDRDGRFPWEPDFDTEFRNDQLDLTDRGWVNEIAD
jgi:hypothetical protein